MIDIRYAEKLCEKVIGDVMGRTKSFARSMIADFENEREQLVGEVILKIWDRLLSNMGAFSSDKPLTQSEKALACIIRKGVNLSSITMQGTTAHVPLGTLTYRLSKEGFGFSCVPCVNTNTWNNLPMRWISLPGEDFAEFMFEFDSFAGSIARMIDSRLLEEKALAMQYSIICQTVDQLGEQYLKPAGITWNVGCDFTDIAATVTFVRKGYRSIFETIRFKDLAEVISGIPARMDRQPREKKRRMFIDYDDDESIFP